MRNTSNATITNILTKPKASQAWAVCMVASLFFFYMFIQITKFNAIGHELMAEFSIDSTDLGALSSAYFWGCMLLFFPAGLLLDRFSIKKIMLFTMSIAIVCTFLLVILNNLTIIWWDFLFTGMAGAFALMSALRLVSRWFLPEKTALASGMVITVGFLGAMVSQSPLTWLVNVTSWRTGMMCDAALGVVLIALITFIVKDFPSGTTHEMTREQLTSLKFLWTSIKKALHNKQNWLFGIFTCLTNLPIFVFGAVFGLHYLVQAFNITENQAAFAMTLLFLGAMAGSPAFGLLSDKMKNRKVPMHLGAISLVILLLIAMYANHLGYLATYVLFFMIGFLSSAQVITYAVIPESNTDDVIATSIGIASILIMSGGAIFTPLFGWLLDWHWQGATVNGAPLHSISEYRFALWLLPISCIASSIIIAFGKETHCKKLKNRSMACMTTQKNFSRKEAGENEILEECSVAEYR